MKHPIIDSFEKRYLRKNPLPKFKSGDTVCVWVKIREGNEKDGTPKYRLQAFEGVCLRYRRGTTNSTFMIRKQSAAGIGVDRNFFTNSPLVDHVDVKMRGKVRRSRIYYIRELKGKAARIASVYASAE